MILLHAGICGGQLYLWGEVPFENQTKNLSSSDLLYAAAAIDLANAASETGVRLQAKQAVSLWAWLPTRNGIPLPSSPLISDLPHEDGELSLTAWQITAIQLPVEEAVNFLGACGGKKMLAPGILLGSDVQFFVKVLRFTASLTAHEQFLPGLHHQESDYQARWQPVLTGRDEERATLLARAMPHACRALTQNAETEPKDAPLAIISGMINTILDYLIKLSWIEKSPPGSRSRSARKKSYASVHDQWIHALRSWNADMSGEEQDLEFLDRQIQGWRRSISISSQTPFRLSFRLEEPEDDSEQWYVRYLLNAVDDPSLYIEIADAWVPDKETKSIFSKYGANMQEYLLTSLGHVSSLDPVLESSLKQPRPGGARLDHSGAHLFLTETSWLLQQAGYSVELPAWWSTSGPKRRLSVRAKVSSPKMQGSGVLSLEDLVEFDWQLAIGDEKLSLQEIETLTHMKMPLVKIRGQWMQFDAEAIQQAIDFWKKKGTGKITARNVVHMALGTAQTPSELFFEGVQATGWVGDLLHTLEHGADIEEIPASKEFDGTLRPYQSRGLAWLTFLRQWGFGACLADDMGLGKTPQTLAFIQRYREENGKRPVLVVCPTSVMGNWQKEAAHFTPNLPVLLHHGPKRVKEPDIFKEKALQQAIVITGFPLLHRDAEVLHQVDWGAVIVDEAQNIKNPGTKQAKAARAIQADYRIALTGTPVENNVGELWSIMEFINPGFLYTQAEFKRQFFIPIQVHRSPEAAERLRQITRPFILRRLKTDKTIIDDLPEKQETNVFTQLTKEQVSLYRAVVKETSAALDQSEEGNGIERKGLILATLTKLKQICNHPAQFLHDESAIAMRSGKLNRLTEMLEEVHEVRDRVLIFTQFAEMGRIIQRHLQATFGSEAMFLHGGVPKKQRDRMVERFQHDENGPLFFLLSLKAAGTGLNLTRANHVFHYDRWWNPAVENQATDRAFRIGQTKHVQVYKFVCTGTVEEHINTMIEEKQEVADQIVSTGEKWITELSTRELKKILKLQKEAVQS